MIDLPPVFYLPRRRDERPHPLTTAIAALILAALSLALVLAPPAPGKPWGEASVASRGD